MKLAVSYQPLVIGYQLSVVSFDMNGRMRLKNGER